MDCSPLGSSVHGDSPGKNIGVGCHFILQEIFSTQGLNPGLPHCRQTLYCLNHRGSPGHMVTLFIIFDLETFLSMMCKVMILLDLEGRLRLGGGVVGLGKGDCRAPSRGLPKLPFLFLIAQNSVCSGRGTIGKINTFVGCISKRQKVKVIAFSPMTENAFLPFNCLT